MFLLLVPIDEYGRASRKSCSITNDFTTGNFSQTSSRDFDFPIHTIPNRADILFGIEDKEFSDVKCLSSGSNVIVYTGIHNKEFIAVKMLKSKIKNKRVAVEELNLEMQILAKVDHENIIQIRGAGEQPRKFITLEYLRGGTLDKILAEITVQEKGVQKNGSRHSLTLSLRWQTALPIALQLASVLKYLHQDFHPKASIIHRGTDKYIKLGIEMQFQMLTTTMVSADNIDLKPQNIGFSADGKLKLFDFGLAACVKKQQLASDTYEMTGFTGTLVYMAPEVYLNQPYNEKVDVYSFAMILWELISGEQVFSNMSKDEHMQEVVLGGQRPSLSPILARAPAGVARLLERCWHAKHQRRPDFASIERDLLSICDDETAASTPSSGCEASPAPIVARSSGGLGWSSMFQRNGGRNIHSSASDFNRDLNQAAKMKVSAKKKTKPMAPKKQGFLGSCLTMKL